MRLLLGILRPYRGLLIAVAITDAIGMLMAILMPYVMSEIVDTGIAGKNKSVIISLSLLMLLLSVIAIITSLAANKLNSKVTSGYTRDLCRATFEKINSLTYTEYTKIGPSGLLTRATDDIFNIEGAASSLVYTIVTVPVMLIGSVALALAQNAVLALSFMLSIPFVMLIVFFIMRPLDAMWDKSDKYVDEQNKIVRERLSALRVVRAFNNEGHEHGRAKFATEEMAKYMIRANVRSGYIEPIAMFLLNLATVAIVWLASEMTNAGTLKDAGVVIAIIQYIALISGALINLSWTIAWLPRLKVSVRRINEIHSLTGEKDTGECDIPSSSISIKNLAFTYPDSREPVLKDISLDIKAGERIAIIGGTGAGKTTLVSLLLAFFDATEGEIILGGKDYRTLNKSAIRNKFSVSLQRGMIFEGTVRDNVKMGKPDAKDSEIFAALDDCSVMEFIKSREDGLDFLLVGSGTNVSGGQKQRLNMARAVIREADIYIFDDSFSALDFLTEKTIKERLSVRLQGKTQITVTQRVSCAMSCERIYVMDRGRIVATGTHGELMKKSQIYKEICISQLGKESVGGDNQ